ncbi:MAG TPA: hypothetical protein PKV15_07405, partial [Syntrophomonadaceae bacterium]|nr:hypothetical protein [Syntrophomonadaceae bacterium]
TVLLSALFWRDYYISSRVVYYNVTGLFTHLQLKMLWQGADRRTVPVSMPCHKLTKVAVVF